MTELNISFNEFYLYFYLYKFRKTLQQVGSRIRIRNPAMWAPVGPAIGWSTFISINRKCKRYLLGVKKKLFTFLFSRMTSQAGENKWETETFIPGIQQSWWPLQTFGWNGGFKINTHPHFYIFASSEFCRLKTYVGFDFCRIMTFVT